MTRFLSIKTEYGGRMNDAMQKEVERIGREVVKRQQEKIEAEYEKTIFGLERPMDEKKTSFPDCKPVVPSVVDWKITT